MHFKAIFLMYQVLFQEVLSRNEAFITLSLSLVLDLFYLLAFLVNYFSLPIYQVEHR